MEQKATAADAWTETKKEGGGGGAKETRADLHPASPPPPKFTSNLEVPLHTIDAAGQTGGEKAGHRAIVAFRTTLASNVNPDMHWMRQ